MIRDGQMTLDGAITVDEYDALYKRMRKGVRGYPSYIFALTMGTGKTILMATCIFYEFVLANKFPRDPLYCHNALVFAPDTTVLESLREIMTFDMDKVVPAEYVSFLWGNIKYHYLDEAGTALATIDNSRFNVIISNTQKVILKRQLKDPSLADQLFKSGKPKYEAGTVWDEYSDLYDEAPEDETDLVTNQRFEKLRRLEQLGIYVDEAHRAFGNRLERDMGVRRTKTSLRLTINELAASLDQRRTQVVGCYNYTGTPYAKNEVLPEVVYAFGLQEAIDKEYLKPPHINDYENPRSAEFVKWVIDDFLAHHDKDQRYEGMRPKLAFFAATIDELQNDLRPAVEAAIAQHPDKVTADPILVNVGDEKLTTSEDIREFTRLDTAASEKQFILLVGKGREGWNCRSLFGVALFRKPRSKVFVLQATMRCLRSITDVQQTGWIYLSSENLEILRDELEQNFRATVEEIGTSKKTSRPRKIWVKTPVDRVKLARVHRRYEMVPKVLKAGTPLGLGEADTQKYRVLVHRRDGIELSDDHQWVETEDLTHLREKREFTAITLVAEITRYLNKPCLEIEKVLAQTAEGVDGILAAVNEFNELLYDVVIPKLFENLYEITSHEETEEYEVELVKVPPEGHYLVSATDDMVVGKADVKQTHHAAKTFHLDPYCFDSGPERRLFWDLVRDRRVERLYFTGMLTHGQSEFYVQYIDPESHVVRSYYPDFLFEGEDGKYVIVEVKGDNKIEDDIVLAKKAFAEQMAAASGMRYEIIKGSDANAGRYEFLITGTGLAAVQRGLSGGG